MSFSAERWHLNGFNLCEIIVIRDGPDVRGHSYLDGRHQVSVKIYDDVEDARKACDAHNRYLPE